jgi:hypothetical protein
MLTSHVGKFLLADLQILTIFLLHSILDGARYGVVNTQDRPLHQSDLTGLISLEAAADARRLRLLPLTPGLGRAGLGTSVGRGGSGGRHAERRRRVGHGPAHRGAGDVWIPLIAFFQLITLMLMLWSAYTGAHVLTRVLLERGTIGIIGGVMKQAAFGLVFIVWLKGSASYSCSFWSSLPAH